MAGEEDEVGEGAGVTLILSAATSRGCRDGGGPRRMWGSIGQTFLIEDMVGVATLIMEAMARWNPTEEGP